MVRRPRAPAGRATGAEPVRVRRRGAGYLDVHHLPEGQSVVFSTSVQSSQTVRARHAACHAERTREASASSVQEQILREYAQDDSAWFARAAAGFTLIEVMI